MTEYQMYNSGIGEEDRLRATLRRLGGDEFRPFLRHLESLVEDRSHTLRNASDMVIVHRMQGEIRALTDILDAVAKATKADRKVGA